MTEDELRTLLKLDLQLTTPPGSNLDTYLSHLIRVAREAIREEGITTNISEYKDCHLIVMYAAYLYRKRAAGDSGMPRMLRYALNNRLFAEKMGEAQT